MARQYRRGAIAVFAAAALTTAAPAAPEAPTAQQRGESQVTKAWGPRRGRPRKFNRAARAVTLTLPEDVIATLQTIDSDLSRALVRAVQPFVMAPSHPPATLRPYGGGAVISVIPARVLQDRLGVDLVPLTDGHALISFDDRTTVDQLELRVRDALADSTLDPADRPVLAALADILQESRQDDGIAIRRRGIIVLHLPESGEAQDV
jgi:hypothetical protein